MGGSKLDFPNLKVNDFNFFPVFFATNQKQKARGSFKRYLNV